MNIKYLFYLFFVSLFVLLSVSGCASVQMDATEYKYGDQSNWYAKRWAGIVRQELDFSCGITSVATIRKYHFGESGITERRLLRDYVTMLSTEDLADTYKNGTSLTQLSRFIERYGYTARYKQVGIKQLRRFTSLVPAIVYLESADFKHFAVVRGVSDLQVLLADSARGNVRIPIAVFEEYWKGGKTIFMDKNGDNFPKELLSIPDSEETQVRFELLRSTVIKP